ncbi:MAG TPA: MucB/RseB C-terminal domain-containing protein [Armatimonadota bacterium]|nr:MucB/RseB C-terminal domain-containing protein [Armatimonadota bacterium]
MLRSVAMVMMLLAWGAACEAQQPHSKSASHRWLRLMAAGRQVPYEGVQTIEMHFAGRRTTATARVAHSRCATRTKILSPAHMRGMEILERGGRRLVRRPGGTHWSASLGSIPPEPHRLLRNYRVSVQGTAETAGRDAIIGTISSRASGKQVRRIWLDSEKGVVLRAEHYNWEGRLVYSTEFQEIDYAASLDEEEFETGKLPIRGPRAVPVEVPDAELPKPSYVPAGFKLIGSPCSVRTKRGDAIHLRYGDGLNVISVFVRKQEPDDDRKKPEPRPSQDEPFSAIVHRVKGGYRVTIIGDINPAELRRMADSID